MMEQLDSSALETWPQKLSKFLKHYSVKAMAKEADYQVEVILAHTHYLCN